MKFENLTENLKACWYVEKAIDGEQRYFFEIFEVKHRGFFAPVKPITQFLRLDWSMIRKGLVQHAKKFRPVAIKATAADDKQRLMLCLPVSKLLDYLDITSKSDWNHREVFARETYKLSDFQPTDSKKTEWKPRSKGRVVPTIGNIWSLGLLEACAAMSLKRPVKNLDELLIMAFIRCYGLDLNTDSYGVTMEDISYLDEFISLSYCMKDVCRFLGFSKYRDALKRIDPMHIESHEVETSRGWKSMRFVTTAGVQELITKSRRPELRPLHKYFVQEHLSIGEKVIRRSLWQKLSGD